MSYPLRDAALGQWLPSKYTIAHCLHSEAWQDCVYRCCSSVAICTAMARTNTILYYTIDAISHCLHSRTRNVWTKVLLCIKNVWTKLLLCTQNVWTKVMLCNQNVWTKVLLFNTNMWTSFTSIMVEQKSYFAPKMFEQKSCFAPKMFEQNSYFVSIILE